ncbi:Sugar ABC superfamily ATP binding cassette transporter, membrane protein, partial [human gut metagenome]
PFKGAILALILAILMVPGQVYLIPQYQIIQDLHLLETPWGVALPGIFSAFGTFLMRQSFMSLPRELEESARLDGASPFQTFWKVM